MVYIFVCTSMFSSRGFLFWLLFCFLIIVQNNSDIHEDVLVIKGLFREVACAFSSFRNVECAELSQAQDS